MFLIKGTISFRHEKNLLIFKINSSNPLDYSMFVMVISASIRCGVEQWQLVGLITRRSQVQVLPPLLTTTMRKHGRFVLIHHLQFGAVSIPANIPTRLYMVTLVKGSPSTPSWIAHDRLRITSAASGWRKGVEPSS